MITTAPVPVTSTFDGTLSPSSYQIHVITAGHPGSVRITLTKAGPPDDVVVYLGVGTPGADGSCPLATYVKTSAGTNPQISGSAGSAGDLCIAIFDNEGVLTEDITYTISVVYPS
jgi:hypothetical protein